MYLDLQELSAEYDALNSQAVTCPHCDGEGHIERTATQEDVDNDPEYVTLGAPQNDYCEHCDGEGEYVPDDKTELDEDDYQRWKALDELDSELGGLPAYAENEPTAIPEHDFEEYAMDLAEDIGAIGREMQWPLTCIDWERAADDLKMDYSSFEFEGTTYYVRAY